MIGIDIVRVDRFADAPASLIDKILTQRERKYCTNLERIAGRFAAKEAVAKAFRTGLGKYIGLQDIEIINDEAGAPNASVTDEALQRLFEAGKIPNKEICVEVSISHEREYAVAMAYIRGENYGI